MIFAVLGLGIVAGTVLSLKRPQAVPVLPAAPVAEPASSVAIETPLTAEPTSTAPEKPETPASPPAQGRPETAPALPAAKPSLDAALLEQAIDLLVSPQTTYGQKQTAWKQLCDAGKLDQTIGALEQRMAADPHAPEYPAALGQAYLKKCATLQDVREQGILGLQADKLFDVALELDPLNWEARFTKAMGLSYWPASMNKGNEVIQHFQTLIQQQEGQPSQPHFAGSYVRLGEQYEKSGRSDYARMVWDRGVSLFPDNQVLQSKLAAATTAQNANAAGGH